MRVFDNPNDPHYGPVRRMWVVLAQLDLLEAAERWSAPRIVPWDEWLAMQLSRQPNFNESIFQRKLLRYILEDHVNDHRT